MRRLGLYLGRLPGFDKAGFDKRELIECVRAADACGYESFWMPEAWEREAFTILTELAIRTQRIHLGTGIVNVFSRSPALIAMSAATLDEISGGRFRLGLGTSGSRVIQDFHGVSFDKPLTYYVGGMGNYYHSALARLGFGAEADRVRELWKAGRRKSAIAEVTDAMVDNIAICAKRSLTSKSSQRCRAGSSAALLVRTLPARRNQQASAAA